MMETEGRILSGVVLLAAAALVAPAWAGGARLSSVDDAEVCVCSNGAAAFSDRPYAITEAAAKRLAGKLFFRRSIEGGFAAEVVEGGELFVVTPNESRGRAFSQGTPTWHLPHP